MKNRITVVRDDRGEKLETDRRIAYVTGKHYIPRANYYRDVETGEDYWTIGGALAFPAKDNTPGFGVIVGVKKDQDPEEPVFNVLDEIEQPNVEALLRACESRRHIWGYPYQLELFYADPERYQSIIADFNSQNKHFLHLSYPYDFQAPNRSEIYLERIRSYLSRTSNSRKRLVIGSCQRLRSHLQNLPSEIQRIEDYPAAAAIGYCVHTLEAQKPWMMSAGSGRYINYADEYDELDTIDYWDEYKEFETKQTC